MPYTRNIFYLVYNTTQINRSNIYIRIQTPLTNKIAAEILLLWLENDVTTFELDI